MTLFMWAGWGVLILTMVATLQLVASTVFFFSRWRNGYTDLPFAFLLVASYLGLPVILYENLIFVHLYVRPLPPIFTDDWLTLFFMSSAVGVVFYNLFLLSVRDYQLKPIVLLSFLVGISIGGMIPSLHLDLETISVIFYAPVEGGYLFVFGILLFNLIGFAGFSLALLEMDRKQRSQVGMITFLAVATFMLAPIAVLMERLYQLLDMPLNFVFIPFLLSSILHTGNYLIRNRSLPIMGSVEYVLVMGEELSQVSYPVEIPEFLPFISSIDHLQIRVEKTRPIIFGSSEMEVVVSWNNLTGLVVLKGMGSRTARRCLRRLISLLEEFPEQSGDFEELVKRYFYPFFLAKGE